MNSLKTILHSRPFNYNKASPLQKLLVRYAILKSVIAEPLENVLDPEETLKRDKNELESIKIEFNFYRHILDTCTDESLLEEIGHAIKDVKAKNLILDQESNELYDSLKKLCILHELKEFKTKGEKLEEIEYYFDTENS
ncbi:MAG TPA: hypothetical protein VK590_06685 [Saprospiraceae bacterium]|nr:hypothetical protein [Saprospiraceae bacterium]